VESLQDAAAALSWQSGFTLAVVSITVALLVRDRVAPAMAVLGATIALLVSGVINPAQAFAGFANPAPITVAALFIVARAVEKTGALQPLVNAALGRVPPGREPGLARLLIPTAGASAFLNNTPIVAMVAPQVAEWARKRGFSPSRYLMPLSFATILGGMLTLVGTSTNLVVSGLLEQAGHPPIGMFEITRLGLPVAAIGIAFLVVFSRFLLPERRTARQAMEEEYREFAMQAVVLPGGAMDGQTVEAAGLRHLQGVFLAEVRRREEVTATAGVDSLVTGVDSGGGIRYPDVVIAPATPETVLLGGDELTFVGRVDVVRDLQGMSGLASAEQKHTLGSEEAAHTFFEAVVSGASSLAGSTLAEADFRNRFQGVVVAIHRAGARVNQKLGGVRLKEGDTLLVLSDRGFRDRWRDRNEFLLVSHLGGNPPPSTRNALLVGAITVGVVAVAGAGLLPMLHTALLGALAIVAFGILSPSEARSALDMDVLVVIAASFGIGAAIDQSGLAAILGKLVLLGLDQWGPVAVLLGVVLATSIMTELITNNAAAVLIFPVALSAAASAGLDPRPFAIAIAVAASASFLTPIGYQTNTMVYGLGGYRFTDYFRLGLPLNLAVILAILLFVPLFWPF
jgi:di/tricarboxylate transporter